MKKQFKLMLGDNISSLKKLPDNSIDSIVTDAPYGLGKEQDMNKVLTDWLEKGYSEIKGSGFMGKVWDAYVPQPMFWKEIFRVLKPGGHVLSFFGTRTYDIGTMALRLAGFEIRDQIMWIYGSGFPKSHNIGKAVDKIEGNEREVVGVDEDFIKRNPNNTGVNRLITDENGNNKDNRKKQAVKNDNAGIITKGNSPYEGFGTAIKPAVEPICVARKPLSEKTIAENVLKWGTGGINIDGCRIGTDDKLSIHSGKFGFTEGTGSFTKDSFVSKGQEEGRFPANIIFDESAAEILDEQSGVSKAKKERTGIKGGSHIHRGGWKKNVEGRWPGDNGGGASRFFYIPKVGKKERNMGLDGFEDKIKTSLQVNMADGFIPESHNRFSSIVKNSHPTVKPVQLMAYLCRLVTPPNGIVLDPFMGSGSTGISACLEGFRFVGMEMSEEYFKIAEGRIENYEMYREFLDKKKKKDVKKH